ncbi:MAG: phosphatidylglycerophosphatase A [Campylobacterales bacterium]|nr:phosphatidylglycerophosphatase A [Campylobacterales bacterium]
MNKLFVTVFYSGCVKKAPGTVGSFVALILGLGILYVLPHSTLASLAFAITVIGSFEINKYQKATGVHDPKEVVIDEVAGMWLGMSMVPFGLVEGILTFIFFRIYDIWKPSLIGKIDQKMKNGFGVMLDDLLAGVLAGVSVLLILKAKVFLGL